LLVLLLELGGVLHQLFNPILVFLIESNLLGLLFNQVLLILSLLLGIENTVLLHAIEQKDNSTQAHEVDEHHNVAPDHYS